MFVAKVLGTKRKFPAVPLPLPLGEVSPQVTERAHADALSAKVSSATRNFPATAKSRPLGEGGIAAGFDGREPHLFRQSDEKKLVKLVIMNIFRKLLTFRSFCIKLFRTKQINSNRRELR